MAEFEMECAKKVDEDAKILALKSIMPDTLFCEAGVFRGRSFNFYADLRTIKLLPQGAFNDALPTNCPQILCRSRGGGL